MTVLLDYQWTIKRNYCKDQRPSADALRSAGVAVHLVSGVPIGPVYQATGRRLSAAVGQHEGIQHSKMCWVGRRCILGSVNWTRSSRANRELAVELELDEAGCAGMAAFWTDTLMAGSRLLSDLEHAALTDGGYGLRTAGASQCRQKPEERVSPEGVGVATALRIWPFVGCASD